MITFLFSYCYARNFGTTCIYHIYTFIFSFLCKKLALSFFYNQCTYKWGTKNTTTIFLNLNCKRKIFHFIYNTLGVVLCEEDEYYMVNVTHECIHVRRVFGSIVIIMMIVFDISFCYFFSWLKQPRKTNIFGNSIL